MTTPSNRVAQGILDAAVVGGGLIAAGLMAFTAPSHHPAGPIAASAGSAVASAGSAVERAGDGSVLHRVSMRPPTSAPRTPAATPPARPAITTEPVATYLASPSRAGRISARVRAFGQHLLFEYRSGGGGWGPFDAYCFTPDNNAVGFWLSSGQLPRTGEVCSLQHNPQYGGRDMQVDADVAIGAHGAFDPADIRGATVNGSGCTADLTLGPCGWSISTGIARPSAVNTTDLAVTARQAQATDNRALVCLAETVRALS